MEGFEQMKEEYWKIVSYTRKSGRISQSVKRKMEEKWNQYDQDVVMEALRIHKDRYPGYKESYTIGIMRNLQKKKEAGGVVKAENKFNQIEQHDYDFDAIQRALERKAMAN